MKLYISYGYYGDDDDYNYNINNDIFIVGSVYDFSP